MPDLSTEKQSLIVPLIEFLNNESDIIFCYLFGSFIEQERYHDIDLAIFAKQSVLEENPLYQFSLAQRCEKVLNFSVDISVLNYAPDHFVHHASRGILILNRDPEWHEEFITAAWSRYFDFAPKRKAFIEELAARQ
ncbi:MAG: nucleotidyltransferase domain-containing protein [bacterium]